VVPDTIQRDPVQKPTQGSLLVLNLSLKLFVVLRDFMIAPASLSIPAEFAKEAYVGCLTMSSLEALMEERRISMQTITEYFQEVFRSGQGASDTVYLVQCEVRRTRRSIEYKRVFKIVDPAIHISTHKELNPKRGSQDAINQLTGTIHVRLTVHLADIMSIVKRD
jgi:hypothetical protein